jgi:UDP-2-acetamido-3-amino-2,3-dideoxy-glucuronate N-acetyltransferase
MQNSMSLIDPSAYIHPTAVIDGGAVVGAGTRIWHFCHLMRGAVVGDNCILGQNVYVDNNVQVGNGVKIQNNVSLFNGVSLADDVFIGPSVVFTNVINPRAFVERKEEFRPTAVGHGASIGANATIICGVSIGEYAFIGAGAVVTKDIPPHALVTGNPARVRGWVSRTGYKLDFAGKDTCFCSEENTSYQHQNGLISMIK